MEYSDFIYAGFHIKRAPVWFREGLAKLSETAAFSIFLKKFAKKHSCEIVPFLTCNRFEMLFVGFLQEADIIIFYEELLSGFEEENKLKLKNFNYSESLRVLKDDEALRTLIGVASSLDSLIVGESQIFGQVKKSYFQALDLVRCYQAH